MARRMDFEIENIVTSSDSPQSSIEDALQDSNLATLKKFVDKELQSFTPEEITNALCFALKQGDIDKIKVVLETGLDVNGFASHGSLPINVAVSRGTLEMVQALVAAGAGVNKRDRQGRSPLHTTATSTPQPQAVEIAEFLISRGADVEGRDTSGESALMRACYCSSLDMVQTLLKHSAKVNQKTPYNRTALHYATMSENTEKVSELLCAGADPNVVDLECESPLILATQSGKLEIVRLLCQANCDLNIKGAMGYNSLHWAMITNEHKIASYLIDHGIDVNTQSCLYRTPLHQAASTNALSIVLKLLHTEADTEVMDSNQETPLLTACRYGHAEVARELLLGNARTELGSFGVTALEVAVDHGFLNIAVMLMLADCDPNVLMRSSPDRKDIFENFRRKSKREAAMQHMKKFLRVYVRTPRHLQQQCRVIIRRVLSVSCHGYRVTAKVTELPLPEQLKDYVNRKDLQMYDPTTYNL